mmetsp:Transcript_999/g.1456  ORF Transcript_999/g.1456 Transcript_999/m.1456 type:complete len:85 (-) Transcript_999:648-902(-)
MDRSSVLGRHTRIVFGMEYTSVLGHGVHEYMEHEINHGHHLVSGSATFLTMLSTPHVHTHRFQVLQELVCDESAILIESLVQGN